MAARVDRANLDTNKSYIRVRTVNGVVTETPVGFFVRSYRMGSGDGMTVHWEFNLNGTLTTENDEMWGSVSGSELTWFKEATASASAEAKAKATVCDTPCDPSSCACK